MNNGAKITITYPERIPEYVRRVMNLLEQSGSSAFVAGGAVRDIVRGTTPHDYDIATSSRPYETIRCFERAGIPYYDNGIKHGTVTAITDGGNVEVTTFREDGTYTDLRRPDDVVFVNGINDDVKRRDFTINAMYMDSSGRIFDPEGGREDCQKHLIRAVGDPEMRFGEDALRILRGLRFCSKLGYSIEENTLKAMEDCADELKNISGERIASELLGIVTGRYASRAVRTGWRILSVIIPEIGECHGFDQRSSYHDLDILEHTLCVLDNIPYSEETGRDPELAVAALFHDLGKPACFTLNEAGVGHMKGHPRVSAAITDRVLTKLKFPRQFTENVCLLVDLHDTYVRATSVKVHRFMSKYPGEILDKLQILQRADILAHSQLGQQRMEQLEAIISVREGLLRKGVALSIKELEIDGNDIIALGVRRGPEVGAVLEEVFEHYIEEKCLNNKDSLIKEAQIVISEKTFNT